MDLESVEKLFALMREHGVLRVELKDCKVEMDPTLLGAARVTHETIPNSERLVAGGDEKAAKAENRARINPLLRHKSLGLDLEFEKHVAP